MTYKIVIRAAAEKDLKAAQSWYDKRQQGVGTRFLAAFEDAIRRLQKRPDLGVVVYKTLRRKGIHRFMASSIKSRGTRSSFSALCMAVDHRGAGNPASNEQA